MYIKSLVASIACISGMMVAQFNGEANDKKSLADALKNPMVIVDYHAEAWCGPCKKMGPIFKSVAQKFDTVKFYKVNIDKYDVSDIQGVPTFVFYKNGKEIRRFSGTRSEADFTTEVKNTFNV